MGKNSDISINRLNLFDHTVNTITHLLWRFSTFATIFKEIPIGYLFFDLHRCQAFEIPIVPFGEIGIDDHIITESGKLTCFAGTLERTAKNLFEFYMGKSFA